MLRENGQEAAETLSIAGVVMRFAGGDVGAAHAEAGRADAFAGTGGETADLAVTVHRGPEGTDLTAGNLLFDSGGPWKLLDAAGRYRFALSAAGEAAPYQVLDVERGFRSGDLYDLSGCEGARPAVFYPLDELLLVNLLAHQGIGVEVHALGLNDNGRGLLFVGVSGSGKSSAARLWAGRTGVTALSDDRIVLRRQEGRIYAHGTPWHGDAGLCDPGRAPLERIFFIGKAPACCARRLPPAEAAERLFVCSFLPFWSPDGLKKSLAIIDDVVSSVPCYALDYPLEAGVVEFARGL